MLWKIVSVALARQGKDALEALRKAAQLLPDDAEAHRNLGALLLDRGRLEEALPSLRRVLEIEPRDIQVLMATANALCALGRARESVALYRGRWQIDPRSPEAHNNLGNAFQELGECAEAVGCYRLALAIKPDDAETHCNLSNALRQLGELHEAVTCSSAGDRARARTERRAQQPGARARSTWTRRRSRRELPPGSEPQPPLRGGAEQPRQRPARAGETMAKRCRRTALPSSSVRSAPTFATTSATRCTSSDVSLSRRQVSAAALALRPDYAPAHLGLATALRLQGGATEAEASCRAALATQPNYVAALCLLGDLCADRGEFGQAQELFQRALAIDADFPALFCSIAAHRKMTRADSTWLQGVEALLAKRLPLAHEIGLRYALGKYHDDVRQYDDAFSQYRQANELSKRHGAKYDRGKLTAQVDQIIGQFGSAFVRESHAGASASELPVFIIGMPRSGTSLTEQILASHPEVFGAGEPRFWDGAFEAFTSTAASERGRGERLFRHGA